MKKIKNIFAKVMIILCLSLVITPNVATITYIPVVNTAQAAYNKATIKDVQQELINSGYDCGTADGIIGKKTKSAIKEYQKDNDLKVTGTVNKALLKSLNVTVTKSTTSSSTKKEITVYVTETGSKYHTSGCRYLWHSKIPMKLSDAKKYYDPCSVCNP